MTVCERCGTVLEPTWKFCIHCGAPTGLPRETTPTAVAAEQEQDPTPEPAPEPEPTPEPAPEHRPIAPTAVLALVLGLVFSPFAALFGIIALVRLRTGRERGRLLAVIGLALGVGWTGLLVVIVVALVQNRYV
jgi:hypothetical protein